MEKICVVGLGYVGLPLAAAFAEKYQVIGFDTNSDRVDELRSGTDSNRELNQGDLDAVRENLFFTSDLEETKNAKIYIVTVPTPIDSSNRPDLSPLLSATQMVAQVINEGDLIIYESTVYPGVTESICVPEVEKISHLTFNQGFFVGYSPERINPGDTERPFKKIVKITSGSTPEIAQKVDDLYSSILDAATYKASSIKVAEAAKVIENTQRDVNIALINELALIFDQMEIPTNEVIEAAATKWNFLPFKPGLVGGHCIGVDPYYLTYRAEELGYKPNLILSSRQINNGMGKFIAEKTIKLMIQKGQVIKGARVLVLGYSFKENCPDTRNTRVGDIISCLQDYEIDVEVYDPCVNVKDLRDTERSLMIGNPFLTANQYNAIVVAVAHDSFKELKMGDYERIMAQDSVLIDVKGIIPNPTWRL